MIKFYPLLFLALLCVGITFGQPQASIFPWTDPLGWPIKTPYGMQDFILEKEIETSTQQ